MMHYFEEICKRENCQLRYDKVWLNFIRWEYDLWSHALEGGTSYTQLFSSKDFTTIDNSEIDVLHVVPISFEW
jgi:hypothetical protein